jgi:hypothetical protein
MRDRAAKTEVHTRRQKHQIVRTRRYGRNESEGDQRQKYFDRHVMNPIYPYKLAQ